MTLGKKIAYCVVAGFVPMLLYAFSSGPDPRLTGAPGDSPQACATCHFGTPINSAGGSVTASFSSGSTYTPGQPVNITVTVSDPRNASHGFQMTARLESDLANAAAGRFSYASDAGVFVLCDNGSPRQQDGTCPANAAVEFIEHKAPRTGTWTFTWNPPATAQGPVHFYVAGNAVNSNGRPDAGDHVYTASFVLTPQATTASCGQAAPAITAVRRIEGWGDGNTFSSGSWLEVQGSNFAPITRAWEARDFDGPNAPTNLDGVSVKINGKPGFIEAISPSQINLQTPDDIALGSVPVIVTNCGGTSNTFTAPNLQKLAVAPGILAPPLEISPFFVIGGKQYAQATIDFSTILVGNLNIDPNSGFTARPARPGDSIQLYAIGLGETTPAGAAGVAANLGAQEPPQIVKAPITVKFGDTPATLVQAALYPGFTGMYYLAITVPDVPDGDYQINLTVGGRPLLQDPFFLTVHR